jgi:hypothetical protein
MDEAVDYLLCKGKALSSNLNPPPHHPGRKYLATKPILQTNYFVEA